MELDLSAFAGRVPVELNAGSPFPPIGELTYLLTLPPYGFLLVRSGEASDWPSWHTPAPEPLPEFVTLVMREQLGNALLPRRNAVESEILPQYIAKRRWFGLKDETIESMRIAASIDIGRGRARDSARRDRGEEQRRSSAGSLPLAILWEDEPTAALPNRLALARVRRGRRVGLLTDGFALPSFAHRFVAGLARGGIRHADGALRFQATESGRELLGPAGRGSQLARGRAIQQFADIGDAVMLKIFRRILPGEHPEAEMGRYLTAQGFTPSPPLLGDVVRVASDGTACTLAIALGFVRNQGDAWSWILDQLSALDDLAAANRAAIRKLTCGRSARPSIAAIGRRLGEMHAVLARETSEGVCAGNRRHGTRHAGRRRSSNVSAKRSMRSAAQALASASKTANVRTSF